MLVRAAATALLLTLLCCTPALAADRDRDRMPDSWERRHHVSKPRGDADRDGLRNLLEHRARTNPRRRDSDRDGLRDGAEIRFGWHPRKRDTDRDGIRDGRENAGVVVAVDGLRVTIELATRGRLSGLLEDPAALSCAPVLDVLAPLSPEASDDGDPGTGDGTADELEWDPAWGEQPDDLDADLDEEDSASLARAAQAPGEEDAEAEDVAFDEADEPSCRAALRVGALVHEASSDSGSAGRRLTRLSLVA